MVQRKFYTCYSNTWFRFLPQEEPARAMFLYTFYYIAKIFFLFEKIIHKKKEKKNSKKKKSRYAVSRYAVTPLPVTPLRVLLTTDCRSISSLGCT